MVLLGFVVGTAGFLLMLALLNGILEAIGMLQFMPNYVRGMAAKYPWAYNISIAVVLGVVGYLSSLGSVLSWFLGGVAIMPIIMLGAWLYFTFISK